MTGVHPFANGRWWIQHTTLALWRSPDRVNPCLSYEPLPDGSWHDTVEFQTIRRRSFRERFWPTVQSQQPALAEKTVKGIDIWTNEEQLRFLWRGRGCLAWVKCPCQVRFPTANQLLSEEVGQLWGCLLLWCHSLTRP